MIPFDLERFKKGDIALTRDGREAEFLYYDARLGDWPLGAIIEGKIAAFDVEGLYDTKDHPNDLVAMKPKTKTVYEWIATCGAGVWHVDDELLTEEAAALKYGTTCEYKKTGRKFEVEG
jgi:hypothetical protein